MKKIYKKSLFLFRRDFRLQDNTALLFALKASEEVIAAFIFTPEQIDKNPFKNGYCLQFMLESLEELKEELEQKGGRLYLFHGKPEEILKKSHQNLAIDALMVNRDYTPYSIQRDQKLEKACKACKIAFHSFDDALLLPPENSLKKDGSPYTVFTAYFRNGSKQEVPKPLSNPHSNYFHGKIDFAEEASFLHKLSPSLLSTYAGGRKAALKILRSLSSFSHYDKTRDFPSEEGITTLSAHLKFTTVSPREVYHAIAHHLGKDHGLIRSLYWRDFFTTIAFFFPHVFEGAFRPKFDQLRWDLDQKKFHLWCEGLTGVPIVDAGMREMNATGFMHNRVRMIAASFLIKDLHIDWRWGEKYFAKTLIDYDPSVNNGNWQWVASTGCDAQPYFRIFNPWNQQKKFDPDCIYIKKWIPELKNLSPQEIHRRDQALEAFDGYPPPMANHTKEAAKALHWYKAIR